MAGYDYAAGMSNNAVTAYSNGLRPASKISGIPASLIKQFCHAEEWHHSSNRFNKVNFYDPDIVKSIFGLSDDDTYFDQQAADALTDSKKKTDITVYPDCDIDWIEWGGTRKRPVPHECTGTGQVSVSKNTATITLKDGTIFTKRLSTNGFWFRPHTTVTTREFAKLRKHRLVKTGDSRRIHTGRLENYYEVIARAEAEAAAAA